MPFENFPSASSRRTVHPKNSAHRQPAVARALQADEIHGPGATTGIAIAILIEAAAALCVYSIWHAVAMMR